MRPAAWLPSRIFWTDRSFGMLKGPGRSGTEQNHIEAEFAMKGTHPPQAGLSFHGFFKIVGPAGEFRFVLPVSGLLEQTSESVPPVSGLL